MRSTMDALFATPGMTAVTVVVGLTELLSAAMLLFIIRLFLRVRHSQENLLLMLQRHLRNPALDRLLGEVTVRRFLAPNRKLLWMYVLSTVIITILSMLLFTFQPHLL
ncbi:MAG: hypothetical protein Greene041619_664 [Candidatus Peregrinibacteria bacterium Greene0416_19]|nr:MAG: hypothetical protein Greene041619_664 [Candidatus Peregrinibacteria bacterium Greene0416_19]